MVEVFFTRNCETYSITVASNECNHEGFDGGSTKINARLNPVKKRG